MTEELRMETPIIEMKPTIEETLSDSPTSNNAANPANTENRGAAMVIITFRTDRYIRYSAARIRNTAIGTEIRNLWNDSFISLNMPLHSM